MADGTQPVESVARKYLVLRPHLDERQRRLFLGAEAQEFGRGGIKVVAAATGVHPDTIARGVRELAGEAEPAVRVRAPGGGRKSLAESDPGLLLQLKAFVDPETRGDPMSLLVWTTKSTRNLADALTKLGHRVSDRTVARMLADLGFSLQGNTKVLEGSQHADRDAQFRYLHEQVTEYAAAGQPVISVRYPDAGRLLICADGGGSNGSRVRAWKIELAKFAADAGLQVTVCHLPPGTSKWNKIEHRLFSQITMNWRGRPLISHQVIVDLIAATTTITGLTVQCVLDTNEYPIGVKYTNADVDALPLTRHDFHGEWNYTLTPPDTP